MAKKPPTLTQILNDQIQRSVDAAVRGHNSKRAGKGFSIDVSGSTCLSDARWSPRNGGTLALSFIGPAAGQWVYYGVDRATAKACDSGEAFNDLIRGKYEYE